MVNSRAKISSGIVHGGCHRRPQRRKTPLDRQIRVGTAFDSGFPLSRERRHRGLGIVHGWLHRP